MWVEHALQPAHQLERDGIFHLGQRFPFELADAVFVRDRAVVLEQAGVRVTSAADGRPILPPKGMQRPVQRLNRAGWHRRGKGQRAVAKRFREGGVDVVRKIEIGEGQKTGIAPLATPEDIERGLRG